MKNLVCTVVAKNYLAIALTLGDSIRENWPDTDFVIVLSDEFDGDMCIKSHRIIEAKDFNIPRFEEMAFKYNVIEFSTAIKPYVFEKLMDEYKCQNIFYIDPDMYVYRQQTEVEELLEKYTAVLTPHVLDRKAKNDFFEVETLGAGIYNLGYIALRCGKEAREILHWWQDKLSEYCFYSKRENLFYDQKWMTYLPIYFENIYTLKSKAYNIARWNFAEREIIKNDKKYYVKEMNGNENLIAMFHFSGYKPNMKEFGIGEIYISKEQETIYWELFNEYGKKVAMNDFGKYICLKYKYDYYDNGDYILPINRRIYREYNKMYKNPFSTKDGSFYSIMKKNKMIISGEKGKKFRTESSKKMDGFEKKLRILDSCMRGVKTLIGIEKYSLLLKYFNNYCYEERQTFLIKHKRGEDY